MRFVPQFFLESVARAVNMCRRQHEEFCRSAFNERSAVSARSTSPDSLTMTRPESAKVFPKVQPLIGMQRGNSRNLGRLIPGDPLGHRRNNTSCSFIARSTAAALSCFMTASCHAAADRAAQSGHFICYLNRTYHVLPTIINILVDNGTCGRVDCARSAVNLAIRSTHLGPRI